VVEEVVVEEDEEEEEEEDEGTVKTRRNGKENEKLNKGQKEIKKRNYFDVYILILLKPALHKVN
jgi:hypothetical protein